MTINDPVCQFIRKLNGKPIIDPYRAFKPFLDVKPEEDVSHSRNYIGSQVLCIIPRALKPLSSLSDSPTGEELVVSAKKLFICAHTVNELFDLLQAYRPEPYPRTLVLEHPNNDGNSSHNKKYKLYLTLRL
ncbi:hypothetical protein WN943_001009 [Citrus x changshan-huyou]